MIRFKEDSYHPNKLNIVTVRDMTGWVRGRIGKYTICAKVYDLPSTYGIKNGRVSKLGIYDDKQRRREGDYFGACIVNYDRGWEIRPKSIKQRLILQRVLAVLEDLPPLAELTIKEEGHDRQNQPEQLWAN